MSARGVANHDLSKADTEISSFSLVVAAEHGSVHVGDVLHLFVPER